MSNSVSDHLPIFIVVKKSQSQIQYREVYGRSYRHFSEVEFVSDFLNYDFETLFDCDDPEVIGNGIYTHIMDLTDKHCPIRKIRSKLENQPT